LCLFISTKKNYAFSRTQIIPLFIRSIIHIYDGSESFITMIGRYKKLEWIKYYLCAGLCEPEEVVIYFKLYIVRYISNAGIKKTDILMR